MVTYFSLEWQNWSCHPCHDLSSTLLIVSGSKKRITYGELDGRGNVLLQQDGPLQSSSSREFFRLVEEIHNKWNGQSDFSVPVCDGSCWKIKIRFSNGVTSRIKGTVGYPPDGKTIEEALIQLCNEAGIRQPMLFGCSVPPETDI